MKSILKYQLYVWLVLLAGFVSCDKMNDLHDIYLQQGEKIYLSRANDVTILPGNQRAKILFTNQDPKARSLVVYWRAKTDSLVFSIPENSVGQELEIMLPDLPEDFLTFEFVAKSADGKSKSLPTELSARIYGDRYRASLNNRLTESASYLETAYELDILWREAFEGAAKIEIRYNGTDNNIRTREVPIEDRSIVYLNLFKDNLEYRTGYVPVENAIDTFYTDYATLPFAEAYVIAGLEFNGTNQYMRIPNHTDFDINTNESLTVTCWARTPVTSRTQRLFGKRYTTGDVDNGNTGYGVALLSPGRTYTDWHYKSNLTTGGGNANILPGSTTTGTYFANTWMHIAAVFDVANKRISLYQDGVLMGSKELAAMISITNISDLYVGWWKTAPTANPGEYFSGEIAHLRFWDKTLSFAEIQEDIVTDVNEETPNLIAAYDLRKVEGSGTNLTVPDIKGNHTGILHNFTRP